jgi:hypothetical protein
MILKSLEAEVTTAGVTRNFGDGSEHVKSRKNGVF